MNSREARNMVRNQLEITSIVPPNDVGGGIDVAVGADKAIVYMAAVGGDSERSWFGLRVVHGCRLLDCCCLRRGKEKR